MALLTDGLKHGATAAGRRALGHRGQHRRQGGVWRPGAHTELALAHPAELSVLLDSEQENIREVILGNGPVCMVLQKPESLNHTNDWL